MVPWSRLMPLGGTRSTAMVEIESLRCGLKRSKSPMVRRIQKGKEGLSGLLHGDARDRTDALTLLDLNRPGEVAAQLRGDRAVPVALAPQHIRRRGFDDVRLGVDTMSLPFGVSRCKRASPTGTLRRGEGIWKRRR